MKTRLPNGKIVDIVPRRSPRHCDKCGQPYRRRALIECWPLQKPGHNWGWVKMTIRLGTECCAGLAFSQGLMKAATLKIGWQEPSKMLTPPIEFEKLRVGIRAGIFETKMLEPPVKERRGKDKRKEGAKP